MIFELLIAIVAALFVYIAWRWHTHAVAIVAALLPSYLVQVAVLGVPMNILEILVMLLLVTGFLQPGVRHNWREAIRSLPQAAAICIGLFVIAAVISTIISPHPYTSLGILKGWVIIPLVYGFMVYSLGANYKLQVTDYLIASGVIMALVGISQIGTMDRIHGVYDVPNSLALYLAPLIVLSTAYGLQVTGYRLRLYQLSSIIMFLALLGTKSLAGILSIIFALAYMALSQKHTYSSPDKGRLGGVLLFKKLPQPPLSGGKHGMYGILLIGVLLGLLLLVVVPKVQYLLRPDSSAHVRLQLWSISAELIREHPLLGIGLGTFEPAYQQKLHQRFLQPTTDNLLPEFVFRDPHNWIASFWLNTGLLGLVAFTGLHLWVFFRLWKTKALFFIPYSSFAAALAVLLLFGLVDTIYWKNDLATLQWLLLALVLASTKTDHLSAQGQG